MNSALLEHKPISVSHTARPRRESAPEEPRVLLFTDTLGDINGVSRFINDMADRAGETGRPLQVFTSTRFPVRDASNLRNFRPRFAFGMPGYPDLEIALPPLLAMLREARRFNPHAIHISTPGPVGIIGRIAARRLGLPLLGVYHTDFPAYIDKLFDDAAFSWLSRVAMRQFYKPFRTIFTRSRAYAESLETHGIGRGRCVPLKPGTQTARFSPRFRDAGFWTKLGVPQDCVKILYVGRVSVEKNMPMLTEIWRRSFAQFWAQGLDARLIIVGDGPYRPQMESAVGSMHCHFVGFRHGSELSTLYASSDFFVFPSTTDTLGQVVLEAQASGLPAIVTDVGGPKETVLHNQTGFVLPTSDLNGWVRHVLLLAQNTDLRLRLGGAAHSRMEAFSIHESFEHFWAIHRQSRPDLEHASAVTETPELFSPDTQSPEPCTLPA